MKNVPLKTWYQNKNDDIPNNPSCNENNNSENFRKNKEY